MAQSISSRRIKEFKLVFRSRIVLSIPSVWFTNNLHFDWNNILSVCNALKSKLFLNIEFYDTVTLPIL